MKKNNEACGIFDNIVNEHIKYAFPKMKKNYVKLFNIVLDTGSIPDAWTIGITNPLRKKPKGNPSKSENYRPITLLSCLGKLFTSVILTTLKQASEIIIKKLKYFCS